MLISHRLIPNLTRHRQICFRATCGKNRYTNEEQGHKMSVLDKGTHTTDTDLYNILVVDIKLAKKLTVMYGWTKEQSES